MENEKAIEETKKLAEEIQNSIKKSPLSNGLVVGILESIKIDMILNLNMVFLDGKPLTTRGKKE